MNEAKPSATFPLTQQATVFALEGGAADQERPWSGMLIGGSPDGNKPAFPVAIIQGGPRTHLRHVLWRVKMVTIDEHTSRLRCQYPANGAFTAATGAHQHINLDVF